jgi:TolB-like protein
VVRSGLREEFIAMNEFLQRLKQRKLVQWAIAYVAAAFALLQGIDIVAQQFGWPEGVRRGITLALVVGFFVTLVLAWYHGERGAQRVSSTELLIIGLVLALGGGFLWRFAAASRTADNKTATAPNESKSVINAKSIAVLPFENRSRDPDNAYFADGIQDEILTRLSKIADLKVISRTSTQHYKSAPENLPEIAKELGVAHILEGSVQKTGDAVRVNVQLIKAANDSHLWADTFDRKLTDIFSVESEVAKTIADHLRAKLTGQEEQVIGAKPTDNVEAYDAYLRGLAYTLKPTTTANLLAAQKYLREAVRLDPNFALAWAELSKLDARGYLNTSLQPTVGLREEARQAAETALTLQPISAKPSWPKVITTTLACWIMVRRYATSRRHDSSCLIAAAFLNRWLMSPGGKASGTGAKVTSMKPNGSIRGTLTYYNSRPFPMPACVDSLTRCGNMIRRSTLYRTTSVLSWQRRVLPKPRAIFRALLRFSLRCIRIPTTSPRWKHKFTRRSWSDALHQSLLG